MPVVRRLWQKDHKRKATVGSTHVVLICIRRFSDFPLTTVCFLACVNVSIPHIFYSPGACIPFREPSRSEVLNMGDQ